MEIAWGFNPAYFSVLEGIQTGLFTRGTADVTDIAAGEEPLGRSALLHGNDADETVLKKNMGKNCSGGTWQPLQLQEM